MFKITDREKYYGGILLSLFGDRGHKNDGYAIEFKPKNNKENDLWTTTFFNNLKLVHKDGDENDDNNRTFE